MSSESASSSPLPFHPLGTTFAKNTYHYRQIVRDGEWAIFGQYIKENSEVPCAYEVVRIRVRPATILHGNAVPAHESPPPNESWGRDGFTYHTLLEAKAKFHFLVERREEFKRKKLK